MRLCFSLLNRVTQAGSAYDDAMQHLHDLGLCGNIKEGDTERLGDAIRAHLRERYQLRQLTSDEAEINDVSGDEQSSLMEELVAGGENNG